MRKILNIVTLIILFCVGYHFYQKERTNPCELTQEAVYHGCESVRTLVRSINSPNGSPVCSCIRGESQRVFYGTTRREQ